MKIYIGFLAALLALSAHASIEGTWSCTSRATASYTNITTGKSLGKKKLVIDGQISFYPEGRYEQTTADLPVIGEGVWFQKGREAVYTQDPVNIAANVEYWCSLAGSPCNALSTFSRCTGKESRDGLVYKGQCKGRVTTLVNGVVMYTALSSNFTCSR